MSWQVPVRFSMLLLREWQAKLWIRHQGEASILQHYTFLLYLSVSCHQYLRVPLLLVWQELCFDKWQCGCFCSWPRGVKVMDVPVCGLHHGWTQEQRQWSRCTFSAALELWYRCVSSSLSSPPGFHCRGFSYCLILRQVSRPFLFFDSFCHRGFSLKESASG